MLLIPLLTYAGSSEVHVEVRSESASSFGLGAKQQMPFSDFLSKAKEDRSGKYYLTTQPMKEDEKSGKLLSDMATPIREAADAGA